MRKDKIKETFNVGDVVYFKSGSQRMTIVDITGDTATLLWSDFDSKDIMEAEVPLVALMLA